jgi:flagellar motor switch protein FliN/FliY
VESVEAALVSSPPGEPEYGQLTLSSQLARMPVELDVAIPIRQFRVGKLLALMPGQLIESDWGHGEDLPLAAGQVRLAWTEFEVVESRLAVRITRLG